ncbi:purine/pyrimidine permease [Pueribacillus sp. YX66]|uniref:purine/pyrimidine permease n=1 Tax=Pueribacillus sp. YX66 TaxID=3229242 RepID=UPI00358D1AC9
MFAGVAPVPLLATAGFLLTTKTNEKLPFIITNVTIVVISFFPAVTSIFANIPSPVGYAVMFITIASLASLGIKEYASLQLTELQLFTISLSLMIGISSLFVPSEAMIHLPSSIMLLANNGLILGEHSSAFVSSK